jgi:hypothetical protein
VYPLSFGDIGSPWLTLGIISPPDFGFQLGLAAKEIVPFKTNLKLLKKLRPFFTKGMTFTRFKSVCVIFFGSFISCSFHKRCFYSLFKLDMLLFFDPLVLFFWLLICVWCNVEVELILNVLNLSLEGTNLNNTSLESKNLDSPNLDGR